MTTAASGSEPGASGGQPAPPLPGRAGLVVDLGRNRAFAAVEEPAELAKPRANTPLVPLAGPKPGLVIRWRLQHGCERLTDRIIRQCNDDPKAATDSVEDVVNALGFNSDSTTVALVAVAPAMGPLSRQAICDGFSAASFGVDRSKLVERPVAALAGWLARRSSLSGELPQGLAVVIDNDGGELSAVVADFTTKRLLAVEPLSTGPDDQMTAVAGRIRDMLDRCSTMLPSAEIFRDTAWAATSSKVGMIVRSGSGADHPDFTQLIDYLFPATPDSADPSIAAPSHAVAVGLLHLDELSDYACCWPTTDVTIGENLVRPAGGYTPADRAARFVEPNTCITFGLGSQQTLSHDGQTGQSIRIPARLGEDARLELLPDGRLLALGDRGIVPLSIRVKWPVPGTAATAIGLESVGSRVVVLEKAATAAPSSPG